MRDAAKINIDNTIAEEQDKDWARNFLYPDGRKPYLLFYNDQGYKHALDLVAKARAAWRIEEDERKAQQTSSPKTEENKQYTYTRTTTTRTTTKGARTKEEKEAVEGVFNSLDDMFKNMGKMFDSVFKKK